MLNESQKAVMNEMTARIQNVEKIRDGKLMAIAGLTKEQWAEAFAIMKKYESKLDAMRSQAIGARVAFQKIND